MQILGNNLKMNKILHPNIAAFKYADINVGYELILREVLIH